MGQSLGGPDASREPRPALLDTIAFKLLLATFSRRGRFGIRQWWGKVFNAFVNRRQTVSMTIHGRNVLGVFGNPYPLTTRSFSTFNGPLLEMVHEVYRLKQRPIRLADVGASIGDTVLLVDSNCPNMVSEYICVDGDPDFFQYLTHNLSFLSNVRAVFAQLSRSSDFRPALVRTNPGSASATSATTVQTITLDEAFISSSIGPIDALKIDVDGLDGEVLLGAANILQRDRPCVIFEWHPILCSKTGNSWQEAFMGLNNAGYSRFIWFDKFGNFSHLMYLYDNFAIDALAEYCLADIPADWHYDVIAIPDSSAIDVQALCSLQFSKKRISRW